MTIPGDEMFNYSANRELESSAKVKALEALLIEKGVLSSSSVDKILEYFDLSIEILMEQDFYEISTFHKVFIFLIYLQVFP